MEAARVQVAQATVDQAVQVLAIVLPHPQAAQTALRRAALPVRLRAASRPAVFQIQVHQTSAQVARLVAVHQLVAPAVTHTLQSAQILHLASHQVALPIPVRCHPVPNPKAAYPAATQVHQAVLHPRHRRPTHLQASRTVNRVSRHSLVLPAHRANQAIPNRANPSRVNLNQAVRFPASRSLTRRPKVEACHEAVSPIRSQVVQIQAAVTVVLRAVDLEVHRALIHQVSPTRIAKAFQTFRSLSPAKVRRAAQAANALVPGSGRVAGS